MTTTDAAAGAIDLRHERSRCRTGGRAWRRADAQGCLTAPVVEALHREGLLGMWVPRTIRGGVELDPVSSLEVIENVSYGDPSAGWVLMAASLAIGTGAAYLGGRSGQGVVRRRALARHRGAGHAARHREAAEGGFNLTGSWSFASGIKHGTHIHTLGLIEGTNEARIFVLPVGKAKLIDNWDVLGLRATGSIDYRPTTCSCPRRTRTSRRPRSRCAAATSTASASSASPGSATRAGRAASAGACSTS